MAQTPPAKAPTGPKVSGKRTVVSLVLLGIVLVVCVIEVRAGLGQFLTLRSFNKVSENNLFKNVSLDEAQGMVAAFPSKSNVQVGEFEDVHHYYWFSLLRPLMGEKKPELFLSADHGGPMGPAMAVSFYTSTEGEVEFPPFEPAAPEASDPMTGATQGMGPPGGARKGRKGSRPPLEDAATVPETKDPAAADSPKTEGESGATPTEPVPTEPAPTEPAPTEPVPTEPVPTEPVPTEPAPTEPNATPEPAAENPKSETPAEPN